LVALTAAALLGLAAPGVAGPSAIKTAAADASSTAPARTILLVDANLDMASGKERAKFELQRHALEAAPIAQRGLVEIAAYGGGACGGYKRLADDPAKLGAALHNVRPQGRRNLVAAVDSAIAAFPDQAAPKRIVAIVGGPNQCLAALCAYANRLNAQRPELAVDVIGFGLSDADARRLDCLAANTGGRFTRADDHSLGTALALALAPARDVLSGLAPPSTDIPVGDAPAQASDEEPMETSPAVAAEMPATALADLMSGPEFSFPRGLRISAAYAQNGAAIENGVKFELLRRDEDGVLRLIARTERTGTPLFDIPPGEYVARATIDNVTRESPATVPVDGVANQRIVLDAGRIDLAAAANGRVASHGASFALHRIDERSDAIEVSGRGRALTAVPAGRYRVTARIDAASAEQVVTVAAGELTQLTVDVPLGFLRVSSPTAFGPYQVLRGGQEIARANGGDGLFRLAPGFYRIARHMADHGRVASSAVLVENGRLSVFAFTEIAPDAERRLIAEQPVVEKASLSR